MLSQGGPPGIERLGRTEAPPREVFLLALRSATELVALLEFPTKHFAAFLAWNSAHEDRDAIARIAELLIRSGCALVAAWGEGCSRIDDIVDMTAVLMSLGLATTGPIEPVPGPNPFESYPLVLTTWHEHDSLGEALDFFLFVVRPVEEFAATCGSAVVIAIDQPAAAIETIRASLTRPST